MQASRSWAAAERRSQAETREWDEAVSAIKPSSATRVSFGVLALQSRIDLEILDVCQSVST
jgi:hypothetical protein